MATLRIALPEVVKLSHLGFNDVLSVIDVLGQRIREDLKAVECFNPDVTLISLKLARDGVHHGLSLGRVPCCLDVGMAALHGHHECFLALFLKTLALKNILKHFE